MMFLSKRPFSATLLLWLVLSFTACNGLRVWTTFAWRSTLAEFSASPLYLAISGIFWSGIGLWVLRSLLQRKHSARMLLLGAAAGYSAWYWIDRAFWKTPRENWKFALGLNLVMLFFVFAASYFWKREAHEREPEDQAIE